VGWGLRGYREGVSATERASPEEPPARAGQQTLSAEEHRHRWRALTICLVAGGMCLLDVSIVNVALPSIRVGLSASDSDIQWVVAGYSLAFGMMLVPAGRIGDARSRRTVFLFGVVVFTLASAACGAAVSPLWIAIARVVQGAGGGLITPQVSGFIQNMFRGAERGRAFGLFGATIGISTALGPLLGGLLIQLGGEASGWRWVFYVNVPVGIALIALARRFLPAQEGSRSASLDPIGVLLFASSTLLILIPVVEARQGQSLAERPWWLLGVAAALLALFVLWEVFWARRGNGTLVDLSLRKVPSYVFGVSLGSFYFAGFTAIFLILTLYLQEGLGYSALEAGATQTSFAIGSAISAFVAGRLVERFGRWLVITGLIVIGLSLTALDVVVPHVHAHVGLVLAPLLLCAGIGGGMVISPNVTLSLEDVDPARAGAGGGLLQTAQRVGSAIGVALVLAQFFDRLASSHGDFADAFSVALHTTIGLIGVALVLAVVDQLRRHQTSEEPAAEVG
jgi:EmrB/QacA subfamily drug resistance transporter